MRTKHASYLGNYDVSRTNVYNDIICGYTNMRARICRIPRMIESSGNIPTHCPDKCLPEWGREEGRGEGISACSRRLIIKCNQPTTTGCETNWSSMAARLFAHLPVVSMCNLKVFDGVEQANRMTNAQETRQCGLRFPGYYFIRRNRYDRVTNAILEIREITRAISFNFARFLHVPTHSWRHSSINTLVKRKIKFYYVRNF